MGGLRDTIATFVAMTQRAIPVILPVVLAKGRTNRKTISIAGTEGR